MTEFDAILFDAGGVLLLPDPGMTGPLVAPFGGSTDPETLRRAHFAGAHAMDLAREEGEESDWRAYASAFLRAAGVATTDKRIESFVEGFGNTRWQHPMPEAARTLLALEERNVPIGIVSNAEGQVEGDLARLGICGVDTPGTARVVCVVDSHVVGVRKPDPAIFRHALDALGLDASSRIAYVGDTVFYDVRSATAAGLTPLLHDPYGLHAADPHPSGPHRVLPQLSDLLSYVA
ncbi:HAD family hydrolase [Kineosporia succinea]|uniref:Hydrolase of the HAD superfamily n=1 Tax=Kineosporia succinea TaxID=84632 RepID=A0ABT9P7H8_9ACTN|nr:HAD family hydrolase [Kineosporia succinea]MDP9828005.1 putative hydrolase of the HAD superfamily [Kineosporia succinea]